MKGKLLFSLIAGLLLTSWVNGQAPVANFTISPPSSSGCAPLLVNFTDASSPAASSWSWNFGGGGTPNTSTIANPPVIFNTPGTYTVTLIATNASGSSSPFSKTVTIFPAPTVNFKASDSVGCFPMHVNFTDLSIPGGASTITKWNWDLGNSKIDTSSTPSDIYKNSGQFQVVLYVTNSYGCQSSLTKSKYIQVNGGVVPNFTPVVTGTCKPPTAVNFSDATSGPGALTYVWKFGDGSSSNFVSPSHTYTAAGNYNVTLTATSTAGSVVCTDSLTEPVQINASSVVSSFTAPDSVCVGNPTAFQNTSNPFPGSSSWNFGDGGSSTMTSPTYTFTRAGSFNVTLTNNFGTCTDSVNKVILALVPPVGNFTAIGATASCKPPLTVNFQDQSPGASGWLWDFGDGTPTSNQKNPSHTYTTFGQFTVTLTASNASSCSNVVTKAQFVKVVKPSVNISNLPAFGCAPFTFSPVQADTVVDGIASYSWDFGNGFLSNSPNPPAQVYGSGVFTVTLSIVSTGGCTATFSGVVKVGTIKPVPAFTDVPSTVCINQNVVFTDQSTGPPDQWLWNFGDGTMSSQPLTTSHSYSAPGNFTVTLTVYNHGCNDSISKIVTVNQPLAKFGYSYNCANKNQFTFKDFSVGATGWSWDFGDGSPLSTLTNPPHTYAVPNTYTVKLTVTDALTGCSNTTMQSVGVLAGTDFAISAPSVCKNATMSVSALNTVGIASYWWYFGDGTPPIGPNSSSWSHSYTTAGIYPIKLVYTDNNGCSDSVTHNIQINGPTVGLTVDDSLSCKPLNAHFLDQSTGSPTQWSWNFGDGSPVSNAKSPPHLYNFQGIYSVSLVVTDAAGCSDGTSKVNWIKVSIPKAAFKNPDSLSCPGSTVSFNQNSSGGFTPVYTWDFGNGSTFAGANPPSQTYPGPKKIYNVKLVLNDTSTGCMDSIIQTVSLDTPNASFTVDKDSASCPPLLVHFHFTGNYADSLDWIFDNGSIVGGNFHDVTNTYSIPRTYEPKLIVTSPGGCTAIDSTTITVLGPYGALTVAPTGGCDSLNVSLSVITSGVVKFIWVFGDGSQDSTTVDSTTHHYVAPSDYKTVFVPSVFLVDSNHCHVPLIGDSIVVVAIDPGFTVKNPVVCGTNPIQFNDTTHTNGKIVNYFWDFGDGSTLTGMNPSPSHPYGAQNFYTVKMIVTTQFGCQDSATKQVKVIANPVVDFTGVSSMCVPGLLNFNGIIVVPDTSALAWSWKFYNGQISNQQTPAAQSYPVAGSDSVQLIATNSTGCTDTVTKYFTIYPLPPINAGVDSTICLGQNITLQATGAASYTWQPPGSSSLSCTACANPVASPLVTTTYVVTGASAFGCMASDTVVVTVNQPVTVSVSPLDSVCIGKTVQLTASGAALYAWSPATGLSNPNIGNPLAGPTVSTTYRVIGSDSKYCFSDTQFVKVSVFNYPTISEGPGATILVGSSYQFNGSGSADIVSINWLPVTGLSCTNCLSPLATPINTTTYVVTAINNGNCATADSVQIKVICTDDNFFVPNTFSPNGDGVNDVFYVRGKGINIIPSIVIYNRWGQIVFEKRDFAPNDPSAGWDGTINGKKAPSDVYIYTIQVICDNSTLLPYHGNIALVR